MMRNFNDFLSLLFFGWALVMILHLAIGGLIALFYREFAKDDSVKIYFK